MISSKRKSVELKADIPWNEHQRKMVENVVSMAVKTLPSLPPAERAERLQGIGLILALLGESGKARYAMETADMIRESEKAQSLFTHYFCGGGQ